MTNCPECGSASRLGVEEPRIYDGLLYFICNRCGLARSIEHKVESRKIWADMLVNTHNQARDWQADTTYVPSATFDQMVQEAGEDALNSADQVADYQRRVVEALTASPARQVPYDTGGMLPAQGLMERIEQVRDQMAREKRI